MFLNRQITAIIWINNLYRGANLNKKLKVLIAAVLVSTAIGFVGCSSKNEGSGSAEQNQEALDKQDKTGDTEKDSSSDDTSKDETDVDKSEVDSNGSKPKDPNTSEPENTKPVEEISYVISKYDAAKDKVLTKTISGNKEEIQKPWSVFKELKDFGSIVSEVSLLSYEINDNNVGVINVSEEIYAGLGSYSEAMMIEHLAKAYTNAFKTEGSIINVDGKAYSSGHLVFEIDEVIK